MLFFVLLSIFFHLFNQVHDSFLHTLSGSILHGNALNKKQNSYIFMEFQWKCTSFYTIDINLELDSIHMPCLYDIEFELSCSLIHDSQKINEAFIYELEAKMSPPSMNQKQRTESKLIEPMCFFLFKITNNHILF